jgi:hypothetical protein
MLTLETGIEFIANAVTIIGLLVVVYQLRQEHAERKRQDELEALIQFSTLLLAEEERYERIIAGLKQEGSDYSGIAYRVNRKIKPLKRQVDAALADMLIGNVPSSIDPGLIATTLRLGDA